MIDVGLVDRVDVAMLTQLAVQYARIRQAQRVIERFGLFTRGSVGLAELHRRTLKAEFDAALGQPDLKPVDAEVIED